MPHVKTFPMTNISYFHISTFHSTCEVFSMAVFCSSLISCFPCTLLRYCPSDFDMVPFTPIITGITFVFTFHMHCSSVSRFYILESSQLLSWSHHHHHHYSHSLFHSSYLVLRRVEASDQTLLIHSSAKNFLTIWHVLLLVIISSS